MTKIKLNWAYAKGELDTDTLELVCIPARGKRVFGPDELDAELPNSRNPFRRCGKLKYPLQRNRKTMERI